MNKNRIVCAGLHVSIWRPGRWQPNSKPYMELFELTGYSTTAILFARDSGSQRRPLASRDMFRTEEFAAGMG